MRTTEIKYRLKSRDVEWGGIVRGPTPPTPSSPPESKPVTETHLLRLRKLMLELYQPTIFEELPFLKPADLAPWQRTCPWAQFPRHRGPILSYPHAIVEYIEAYSIPEDHSLFRDNATIHKHRAAGNDLKALSATLATGSDPDPLTLCGMIAALSLFEHSAWGRECRNSVFESVRQDPILSYYFAASVTPTPDEWQILQSTLRTDPRLAAYALRLPHFPREAKFASLLHLAVHKHRRYWFLTDRHGHCSLNQIEQFLDEEFTGPEECLVAFAIAPHHTRAEQWLDILSDRPQYAYEAMCLIRYTGQLEVEEACASKLRKAVMQDPQWAFHWLRDFGEGTESEVSEMLPHFDWIAELVHLETFSIEIAKFAYTQTEAMGDQHWLRSSFLLFLCEKTREPKD